MVRLASSMAPLSAAGSLVAQDMNTVLVEADALNIPENIEVSVEDAEIGTQIYAKDLPLPKGVELRTDEDYLVVQVVPAPSSVQSGVVAGAVTESKTTVSIPLTNKGTAAATLTAITLIQSPGRSTNSLPAS